MNTLITAEAKSHTAISRRLSRPSNELASSEGNGQMPVRLLSNESRVSVELVEEDLTSKSAHTGLVSYGQQVRADYGSNEDQIEIKVNASDKEQSQPYTTLTNEVKGFVDVAVSGPAPLPDREQQSCRTSDESNDLSEYSQKRDTVPKERDSTPGLKQSVERESGADSRRTGL